MMQKRSLYSLLLTSFILVFAFSHSFAQQVTFETVPMAYRCNQGELDITVDNPTSISALEIIFEVSEGSGGAFFDAVDVGWDLGFTVLLHRYVDLTQVGGGTPDVIRIAALMDFTGTDACLDVFPKVVAQVEYTTNNVCAGTVIIDGTTWPSPFVHGTQFVDCATTVLVPAAVVAGGVTIINGVPTIDPIADTLVHWGGLYTHQITGDDPDLHTVPGGCETLEYNKVSGPANLDVNNTTGLITWATTANDMITDCQYLVEVEIEDACGVTAQTSFTIYLWNDEPQITCPDDTNHIVWGYPASGSVSAIDPDVGPSPLLYSVASFSGPGTVSINPATGDWEWPTLEDPAYVGLFELCIAVTDGAAIGCPVPPTNPNNADTCCLYIFVISTGDVVIEKTHKTLQGYQEWVSITIENSSLEFGGFDFLIKYDATALTFLLAEPGQLLEDCDWEYFTYRHGPNGNCGPGACPTGIVRIVAIAEYNDGFGHPSCFGPPDYDPHELVKMKFLVTSDLTFECMYIPIVWIWYDCGDNGMSSVTGDTLFMSRYVHTFEGTHIEDPLLAFPTMYGAIEECDEGDKQYPLRVIDYWNGGIDIICVDSIDDRGDINLDGVANSIADAVLFTNYFVYGLGVFTINLAGQVVATDVNADGISLSVADLVYLIRVVIGDASPYPKTVTPVDVSYAHAADGSMAVEGSQIGAAFLVIENNVTPELTADGMEMRYNFDGVNTRVLVYSLEGNSFTGEFLNVTGTVLSVEMATDAGYPVNAKLTPSEFALHQNYPNPFNPTTAISFALQTACDYSLTIYNVTGQEVAHFAGHEQAGQVVLEWDAGELASGVYFYRLKADTFTDTRKMVLLK